MDTADAAKPARFWAETLGRQVAPGASADFATIDPAEGVPRLSFHQVAG
ncbi:VOC family protein [Streptomyces sp. NPDC059568]